MRRLAQPRPPRPRRVADCQGAGSLLPRGKDPALAGAGIVPGWRDPGPDRRLGSSVPPKRGSQPPPWRPAQGTGKDAPRRAVTRMKESQTPAHGT